MKSKDELKSRAVSLRKQGKSLKDISESLDIPRSTLSGWFKDLPLSRSQKRSLDTRRLEALSKARVAAALVNRARKQNRLDIARKEAQLSLSRLPTDSNTILELALAFLYLGEGAKSKDHTCLGNSNPEILRFFIESLITVYGVKPKEFHCHLHLRADQDPDKHISYWSKTLNLPKSNFGKSSIDKRTLGSKTYDSYKGVCQVSCGRVEIKRKLMYIADGFCKEAVKKRG